MLLGCYQPFYNLKILYFNLIFECNAKAATSKVPLNASYVTYTDANGQVPLL